jgi:4-hydroxy 2-oxovalerate aldolase
MGHISILDCTLRDGGYINSWMFGQKAIVEIVNGLEKANVDIIECGFIEDNQYNVDSSVFDNASTMSKIFNKKTNVLYVGMIALGDIEVEKVSEYNSDGIDGIRLTFHIEDLDEEMRSAKILMDKGYKVFIQPVGTTSYSDAELITLINHVNSLDPYAFYIVDTLGTMYPRDLVRVFSIIDNNLNNNVAVGFHSHNNLQLSFSNAQSFINFATKRDLIVDSSVFGMGRGAGNLPTELITQYINSNYGYRYNVTPLLNIMDRYLDKIYVESPWGYSSPYYLSAINLCHPNYANFLMAKRTINIEDISKILNLIPQKSRALFDKKLIEKLYLQFQSSIIDDISIIDTIAKLLRDKKILIIAAGKTVSEYADTIEREIDSGSYVIQINSIKSNFKTDMLFVSNSLRAESIDESKIGDSIIVTTSNVPKITAPNGFIVNYSSLLGTSGECDNAGIMLLNLLGAVGVEEVYLAGFDGFSKGNTDEQSYVSNICNVRDLEAKNEQISSELNRLRKKMKLNFITPTLYKVDD